MSNSPKPLWVAFLQLAGLIVGVVIGILASPDLYNSVLMRVMLAGPIAGGIALAWLALVWLLFQPHGD
jgi:hypothetical protein